MRDTMARNLTDRFNTNRERKKTPRIDVDRCLDSTILNLPHPEQNEEYERRYDILVNGTPRQKADLLFEALHEAKKGYTREKLRSVARPRSFS